MNICPERPLVDLRHERRQLSEAVARLCWLRRLVLARFDLEVGRLTAVTLGASELDAVVRGALDPGACANPDLLRQLSSTARSLGAELATTQQTLDRLTLELVRRLQHEPASCLAPLAPPPAACEPWLAAS